MARLVQAGDLFEPHTYAEARYWQMVDAERDRKQFPAYYAACRRNYRLTLTGYDAINDGSTTRAP